MVDPASGMDAIGDVAVVDGRISAVGTGLGSAERVIDATGLVVAPGFIDLHAHGQSLPADRMQAFDGVTTTLDLEAGVLPVASWYKRQADKGRVLNYGAAANWAFARIGAMTGSNAESSLEAFGNAMRDRRWIDNVASDTEVAGILAGIAPPPPSRPSRLSSSPMPASRPSTARSRSRSRPAFSASSTPERRGFCTRARANGSASRCRSAPPPRRPSPPSPSA